MKKQQKFCKNFKFFIWNFKFFWILCLKTVQISLNTWRFLKFILFTTIPPIFLGIPHYVINHKETCAEINKKFIGRSFAKKAYFPDKIKIHSMKKIYAVINKTIKTIIFMLNDASRSINKAQLNQSSHAIQLCCLSLLIDLL